MQHRSSLTLLAALCALATLPLSGCGSSANKGDGDLPEICRQYDFSKDPAMAEECGIRQTRYKSYKNIPPMRYLIAPKDAQLVLDKKSGAVELRLRETMPVILGEEVAKAVDFSDEAKKHHLKNQYIYKEIYPTKETRMRLFKLRIPANDGSWLDYCFRVPEHAATNERLRSHLSHSLDELGCAEFDDLVKRYPD